jgi:DNA processing protein
MPIDPHITAFTLSLSDPDFPMSLAQAHPPVRHIFGRGDAHLLRKVSEQPGLAIVGSRQATQQGIADARWFAQAASAAGLTVISGLAQGIDASAHAGGLLAEGKTIAVLGHGLQTVYPAHHQPLCDQILAEGGAVISEYAWGTPAIARHFPQRNRIIAALARAVLIIEATPQSGSLITAKHALDLGVDVFVLPGSIHMPQSIGCNALIRQGAQLTQSPDQLLEDLGVLLPAAPTKHAPSASSRRRSNKTLPLTNSQQPLVPMLDEAASRVLGALSFHPTPVSGLGQATELDDNQL